MESRRSVRNMCKLWAVDGVVVRHITFVFEEDLGVDYVGCTGITLRKKNKVERRNTWNFLESYLAIAGALKIMAG